ncbi:MAG: preprotein translocase subunit SecG [Oscillospiraceae bacterium]|nr:preprotein translocase subunit SecG [Oscillospiraceae bacterium]
MSGWEIALGIVLLVFSVVLVAIVLSQQGEQRNSGVITGGSSDTYISKNSGRTIDAFLARWTKFFAIGFFLCVIAVNIVVFCLTGGASAENAAAETAGDTSSVASVVEDTSSAQSGAEQSAAAASSSEAVSTANETTAESSAA